MRLAPCEIEAIKKAVFPFDPKATIYLFGSRANDSRKGGDIDLLILSQKITVAEIISIKLKLYDSIGEQKIDILLAREIKKPFVKIAMEQGVML